jgi:hypothetical protein
MSYMGWMRKRLGSWRADPHPVLPPNPHLDLGEGEWRVFMKLKVQTQIIVVPPPLSPLIFDNGGGQGGGRMLAFHKSLASAKTPQEKESVQRQIESTDGQIDKLVYELYGLSEEEIKIVEGR